MNPLFLLLTKIVVSATMVISITMVAERGNPRLAGVLMGFPLGAGLAFFFLGIEQGPIFTAESALWSIPGILTALAFCLAYSCTSQLVKSTRLVSSILLSTIAGLAAYLLASILLLNFLPQTTFARTLVLLIGMPLFAYLLQLPAKRNNKSTTKNKTTAIAILIRASFAATIIITITAVANTVGPAWSGLFATFPTTVLPIVLILHYLNGAEIIPSIFRETAFGMVAIVIFAIAVHFLMPIYGVYIGILLCYLIATIYILIYEFTLRPIIRKML